MAQLTKERFLGAISEVAADWNDDYQMAINALSACGLKPGMETLADPPDVDFGAVVSRAKSLLRENAGYVEGGGRENRRGYGREAPHPGSGREWYPYA